MPDKPIRDDLDVRLSVTETKVTTIQGDLLDQKTVLRDISTKVDNVKEKALFSRKLTKIHRS